MAEYATRQLDRSQLLHALKVGCDELTGAQIEDVIVSFGWDSNQPIDAMWKPVTTPIRQVFDVISAAERYRLIEVGKADVFFDAEGFSLLLCHEGDAHVSGASDLVAKIAARWCSAGYEPRVV